MTTIGWQNTCKDEPVTTTAPEGTNTKDPSKKSQDTNTDESIPLGLIIAIIIIVVIVVFIVIDVTCYYKRKCGVFMCIKEKVGRTGSMETRSKEKIIEEGDADGKDSKLQKPLQDDNKQNGLQGVEKEKSCVTEQNNGIINTQKSKDSKEKTQSEDKSSGTLVISSKPKDLNGKTNPVPKNVGKPETKPTTEKETELKQNIDNAENQKQEKRNLPQEKMGDQKQKANDQPLNNEQPETKPEWKTVETLDQKNIIFNQSKPVNQQDVTEVKEEKKVPLLADNKDNEGTEDGEQEIEETSPTDEKEPEDKEEKPTTPEPEKEVEEAEEAKPEDQEKSSPKEEVKEEPGEKKEGE